MRRISAKYARPGMTLGEDVHDVYGKLLINADTKLLDEHIQKLVFNGVGDVLLVDPCVDDVIINHIIHPEFETQAAQLLRQLVTEAQESKKIDPALIYDMKRPIYAMAKDLCGSAVGEPNVSGCFSMQDYSYVQPAKVAALSMLIGKKQGISMMKLPNIGLPALLMNIGYVMVPPGVLTKQGSLTDKEHWEVRKHPYYSSSMINKSGALEPEMIVSILQHHERWNGSGYPAGLKGEEISLVARIIGIVDLYFAMVSRRPYRKELKPHEAMEFIIALAGDQLDPELVKAFSEEVPIYPNGVTVRLSTNQVGIVCDSNIGTVGRPKVRILFDTDAAPMKKPYDMDLSYSGYRNTLITEVLGY